MISLVSILIYFPQSRRRYLFLLLSTVQNPSLARRIKKRAYAPGLCRRPRMDFVFSLAKKGWRWPGQSVQIGPGEISTPYEVAQNELRDAAMAADLTLKM